MTEENSMLRGIVSKVEEIATSCLSGQPNGDDECRLHLMKSIIGISELTSGFSGMVLVEAYDIEMHDGSSCKTCDTFRTYVRPCNPCEEVRDILSRRFNGSVKSFKWRIV